MRSQAASGSHALRSAVAVGGVLLIGYIAAGVADVFAVSGVVAELGESPLLAVWSFDAVVTMAFAAFAASAIGGISPARLVDVLFLLAAIVNGVLALAFALHLPDAPLLFVLAAVDKLEMNVIYFSAWALARELLNVDETVTYYGRINAMTLLGTVAGTGAAGLAIRQGFSPAWVLGLVACSFAGGRVALSRMLGAIGPRPGGDDEAAPQQRTGLRASLAMMRRSPLLRRLAVLGVMNGVGYTVLSLEVIRRIAAAETGGAVHTRFAMVYAALRIGEPLTYTLIEVTVAAPLIRRFPVARLFLGTPIVVLIAMVAMWSFSSPLLALCAACALQAAFGIEQPSRAALIAGLPVEVRAGVGVITDGSFYQIGYLAGCAGLGLLVIVGHLTHVPESLLVSGRLFIGALAAILAIASLTRLGATASEFSLHR